MTQKQFASKIIAWYNNHHRSLPWRETKDPYKIWLSEIILQQTRVAQGLPYYEKFVTTFPTVTALAKASEQQVLRLWQGLGYYSRARNLHACAKKVVTEYHGKFPDSAEGLQKLPGIGPYTAAAIASFAFRESVAVVDGNVFRVLARIFGMDSDIASPMGKKFFTEKANALLDVDQPDVFNQAMMEFGAIHCLPQNPLCTDCIFSKTCIANGQGLQKLLPVKEKKAKVRTRYFYYFVIHHQKKILMRKREGKDIWKGLYDFYLVETNRNKKAVDVMKNDSIVSTASILTESKIFTHLLSHQKLKIKFIEINLSFTTTLKKKLTEVGLKAFTKTQIGHLPKPIVIDRYL